MSRIMAVALTGFLGLAACGEAEMEEVPETAEIEFEEEPGQLELDEETILGPDDVGEQIMATGWVSGAPLPTGFFLRTEDDRVIFVEHGRSVQPGETVRVIGTLLAAEVAVFEGWEADAFDTGFEAEWDVETEYFINAGNVSPVNGMGAGADAPGSDTTGSDTMQPGQPREDAGTTPGGDTTETDPGSKSGG